METEELYLLADADNIDVINTALTDKKSLSIYADGSCAIAIDTGGMTNAEEKTVLAHEMGHCETLSFYDESTPVEIQRVCERRADRWAIDKLIPLEKLLDAYKHGVNTVWELSEYFGVTEDMIRKVLTRYSA